MPATSEPVEGSEMPRRQRRPRPAMWALHVLLGLLRRAEPAHVVHRGHAHGAERAVSGRRKGRW